MPGHTIYVNDASLTSLGFIVDRVEGLDDAVEEDLITTAVAGRAGGFALSARPAAQARTVMVEGTALGSSQSAVDTVLRNVKGVCGGGWVELRSVRNPARMAIGRLVTAIESPFAKQYRVTGARLTLRFTCPDPLLYDTTGLAIAFATTATPIPLGTASVAPLVRIYSQPTSPFSLISRDVAGTVRQTLGFTLTLGANDYLEIDNDAGTIRESVAGTISDAYSTWTTKADGFLVLDPHDGDPVNGVYPTLEVSTGQGQVLYRRSYR